MSDDRTLIDFVRSGGVAGTKLRLSLDGAELPPEEAAELDRMASALREVGPVASDLATPRGADRYQFDISVTRGSEQHRLTLSEDQIPQGVRAVIDRLVELARQARKRGTPGD